LLLCEHLLSQKQSCLRHQKALNYRVSLKSLFISLGLAILSGLAICGLWRWGLIDSIQDAFVLGGYRTDAPLMAPQPWVGRLLVVAVSAFAGFFVGRIGARRSFPILGFGFLLLCGASLLVSRYLSIDILFAPMALGSFGAVVLVQLYRLWQIDAVLTSRVNTIASTTGETEPSHEEQARLMSGLKLLQTILPLEESVVLQPNEDGQLIPCARLRTNPTGSLQPRRNAVWRKLIDLSDRAVQTDKIALARNGEIDALENIAIPLRHEGRTVGALLLRLRESLDQGDRRLLFAVGGQLARNLQREEARKKKQHSTMPTFVSARASGHRLEAFDVVSGFLTEHRFGAQVLAEASDGHAVAYLDGTLAYVNPAMLEAAGLSAGVARDLDLFGLLNCFRAGVFDEPSIAVRRVLQSGEPYQRELKRPDRDQTVELRIALATERSGNGNGNGASAQPLCLAIRARDVTRIKEYEQMKSDMISLMSHELRTPLTSINGFAELLVLDDKLPQESREFLEIISNESRRMSRMIDTFLTVTKLERSDKQEVTKIALRLDEVARETIATLQSAAKKKRIRLVEQPGGRIPPIAADKSLVTQALTNLIDNAIKYSPERTTVTISTLLEADAVRVVVEDRGYGIPHESIDRVWEKFYRVARDGQEKHEESTGLGLSVVKEVVEQHGGSVAIESEVGRGSKFSFALPRL
jgi:two-component system, OmpR family, phosphate regulon sensor histidine kinase PhoR